MSAPDRGALLDPEHGQLSIRRQCALLGVARSAVYRPPREANEDDLAVMRRLDELFTAWPFLGSRRMAAMLRAEGQRINRKRVQRLMRKMGIAALGPKPRTTKPAPGHRIFPYLLRGMVIDRPNQVWAADITYVPIGRGFLYLVAIMDWASRAVLAWRLSNSMDVSFCVSALEEALARFGKPEIFNTDQGSPVHQPSIYRGAAGGGDQGIDGWPWPVDGQCVHRAAVAIAEARGDLSEGLCRRTRGEGRDQFLAGLLQSATAASVVAGSSADGCLACGPDWRARRRGCGYDPADRSPRVGQRCRVAHIPTAAATTTTICSLMT